MPTQAPTDPQFKLSPLPPSKRQSRLSLASDRDIWERQPEETDRNWGCFQMYRDTHPSVRSMAKAFAAYMAHLRPRDPTNPDPANTFKAPSWFERVGAQNRWTERVKEFDAWRDEDALKRLQSLRVQALMQAQLIGHHLVEKAANALEVLETVTHDMILDGSGQLVTVEKSALSPAAIVQLAKAGVELRRYALGMERGGGDGGAQVHVNIANINSPGGRLPNPEADDALLQRVIEITSIPPAPPQPPPSGPMVERLAPKTAPPEAPGHPTARIARRASRSSAAPGGDG